MAGTFVLPAVATLGKEACLQGLVLSLSREPHATSRAPFPVDFSPESCTVVGRLCQAAVFSYGQAHVNLGSQMQVVSKSPAQILVYFACLTSSQAMPMSLGRTTL